MPRFRKKPVEIEAVRWYGSNTAEVADFMASSPGFGSDGQGAAWVDIHTLEGTMRADKGEFYPCKPDIFEASYDLVA